MVIDAGSSFVLPARAPSTRVIQWRWRWAHNHTELDQDGGSNPMTPVKLRRQSSAATKETGPTPVSKTSTNASAIARCLDLTMGKVSA